MLTLTMSIYSSFITDSCEIWRHPTRRDRGSEWVARSGDRRWTIWLCAKVCRNRAAGQRGLRCSILSGGHNTEIPATTNKLAKACSTSTPCIAISLKESKRSANVQDRRRARRICSLTGPSKHRHTLITLLFLDSCSASVVPARFTREPRCERGRVTWRRLLPPALK